MVGVRGGGSFQEYLQCSERVVYESCGNETALFTKNFLNRMAGPIVQDICTIVNFRPTDCPASPQRHIYNRPSTTTLNTSENNTSTSVQDVRIKRPHAEPVIEPPENTFNRPHLQNNFDRRLNEDHRKLQHYHSFDSPLFSFSSLSPSSPTSDQPGKLPSRRPYPAFEFVGIRDGKRIYRRLRHPVRHRSRFGSRIPPAANRNVTSRRQKGFRNYNGKKLIRLRRINGSQSPVNRSSINTGLNFFSGEQNTHRFIPRLTVRKIPDGFPLLRRTRSQVKNKLSSLKGQPLQNNTSRMAVQNSLLPLHGTTTESPRKFLGRLRRLRLLKRMRNLAQLRKEHRRSMFRTLLRKLALDARKYAYETANSTAPTNGTADYPSVANVGATTPVPLLIKLTETDTPSELYKTSEEVSDYEYENAFDEIGMLGNNSLSAFEKYTALLRLKMLTSLEEAVIPADLNKFDYGATASNDNNNDLLEPILINVADTDFFPPRHMNISSWIEEDLSFSGINVDGIWLVGNLSKGLNTTDVEFDDIMNITNMIFENNFRIYLTNETQSESAEYELMEPENSEFIPGNTRKHTFGNEDDSSIDSTDTASVFTSNSAVANRDNGVKGLTNYSNLSSIKKDALPDHRHPTTAGDYYEEKLHKIDPNVSFTDHVITSGDLSFSTNNFTKNEDQSTGYDITENPHVSMVDLTPSSTFSTLKTVTVNDPVLESDLRRHHSTGQAGLGSEAKDMQEVTGDRTTSNATEVERKLNAIEKYPEEKPEGNEVQKDHEILHELNEHKQKTETDLRTKCIQYEPGTPMCNLIYSDASAPSTTTLTLLTASVLFVVTQSYFRTFVC
ncbi:hypothetical protein FHG87_002734 [Trinorchestia longiramus]|nr:hypothetical protein FHG87_002734 [Trinorchestia longiramus]